MRLATRYAATLAFSLALCACARGRYELIGFPVVATASAEESADRLQVGLREIEEAIGRPEGADAGPPSSRLATAESIGTRRLLDTYVALANDDLAPTSGFPPFNAPERRQPLFLYPRLTFPHLAECTTIPPAAELAEAQQVWCVTALLNRGALLRSDRWSFLTGSAIGAAVRSFEGRSVTGNYSRMYGELKKRFHFALVPRRGALESEIPLDSSAARWIVPRSVKVGGERHPVFRTPFELPLGRADAIDLVFEVPLAQVAPRWEAIAKKTGQAVRGELFDLRVFPKIPFESRLEAAPNWRLLSEALTEGRWIEAFQVLARVEREIALQGPPPMVEGKGAVEDMHGLADAMRVVADDFEWFAETLRPVADRLDLLADAILSPYYRGDALLRLRDLQMAIGHVLENDLCPAPVYLDEPDPKDRSYSFIVGADLQYDTDASCLQQFLAMIDETCVPGRGEGPDETSFAQSSEEARAAKFVVIAGDLGDGAGLSSSPTASLGASLGLSTPKSPYAEHEPTPRRGEFPELRDMLRRSKHPIFVVPGNHDGFVSYGGVLNQLSLLVGRVLNWLPLVGFLGDPFVGLSDDLPILIKIWRVSPPFYDGLVDWAFELGPRNLAFHYRGSAFVAANSFDLSQFERDQVGALGNNWGGGLQDTSLAWIDTALRHFSSLDRASRGLDEAAGTSFLFMHHDPRAGFASKNGYLEKDFGYYNDITAPLNELTFGYLGTSSSVFTQIWIPILSPIATGAIRAASYGENFQERWMRSTAWDTSCYNAKGLLDTINRNLEGAPDPWNAAARDTYKSAGLSHIFFGHDDVPVVSPWVHPNGNAVFPEQPSDAGWNTFGHHLGGIFFRLQSDNAPSWARTMHFDDGRQATVVRLDDLGDAFSDVNTHGFTLVTVGDPTAPGSRPATPETEPASQPSLPAKPKISARWFPIPR